MFNTSVPAWLGAAGTIAIAVMAWITLDPLIENLELRQTNRDLRLENEALDDEIMRAERERDLRRSEAESLERQIERWREEADRLSAQMERQQEQFTLLAKTVDEQMDRERQLRERNLLAEGKSSELETAISALKGEKLVLEREREGARSALRQAEEELRRREDELVASLHINRRFALEQVGTKVRELAYMGSDGSWLREEHTRGVKAGLSAFKTAFIESRISTTDLKYQALRAALHSDVPLTGRDLILSQFNSQVFRLFGEAQRLAFQDEIRAFMDARASVFSALLAMSPEIVERYQNAIRVVSLTEGSKYLGVDELLGGLVKVGQLSLERGLSRDEISKRDREYEEAKRDFDGEIGRIVSAMLALNRALDDMVEELTAPS